MQMLPKPNFPENDRGNDPIRKVKCLLEIQPREFWIVTPTATWKHKAAYPDEGYLVLDEI
jgi:hypothetical protein